ncbi:hypothetical protein ACTOB_001250 [Actinoplanes oblitus]|uniref:Tail terminator n=1 Tax=Actinoplanes oblitus TaxID=3040509 RepID=A0ABY8WJR6_9ACTN|nr:hypothetical protein [Actinoplanes oblitus]WIM97702.1 hypothetical protein ACTOB_001250 [Actinoplanes oblitus]
MDLTAVREGLADVVRAALPELTCYGDVPDSISEPAFLAGEVDITYDTTFGDDDEITATCRVLVSRSDDKAGQKLLNAYLSRGPKSIKRAIEGTPGEAQTLGGACDDLHVQRIRGYRYYPHGDATYLGAEFVVKVIGGSEEG